MVEKSVTPFKLFVEACKVIRYPEVLKLNAQVAAINKCILKLYLEHLYFLLILTKIKIENFLTTLKR